MSDSLKSLIVCVGVPLAVGAVTGYATTTGPESEWYKQLKKPEWMPPGSVFAPVWIVLYILMGLACWQVYNTGVMGSDLQVLFAVQLALNAAWSILFFNTRSLTFSLANIGALLVTVAATTAGFYNVSHLAGYMMVPYLLWVVFASALNLDIFMRNPTVL